MKTWAGVGFALSAMLLAGCGGGFQVSDIEATTPSGLINGAAWTMTKAVVDRDGDRLSFDLFADADIVGCPFSSSDTPFIMFSTPAEVGTRRFQLSFDFGDPDNQTLTFVTPASGEDPTNNNISIDGIINITEVTADSVTIGLVAEAGEDEVNGTFTATYPCE